VKCVDCEKNARKGYKICEVCFHELEVGIVHVEWEWYRIKRLYWERLVLGSIAFISLFWALSFGIYSLEIRWLHVPEGLVDAMYARIKR